MMVVPNDHPVRKWALLDDDGCKVAEDIDRDWLQKEADMHHNMYDPRGETTVPTKTTVDPSWSLEELKDLFVANVQCLSDESATQLHARIAELEKN